MVDRITPETSAETHHFVAGTFGVDDRWPVVTERFSQWIVEDSFCNGRPPLEEVGVQFVDDVEPYERMKKRLLNGSHSALGYVGYLLNHRDTAGAMRDPLVRGYLMRLMAEIAPLLPPVPGIDLHEYRATLLDRFSNAKVGDQLARLCGRGSTKVPAYLLPSIVEARRQGRPHELLNLAVAAWVRYLRGVDLKGREIAIKDARLDELQPLAIGGGNDPAPLMANSQVFGWLADDPMLVRSVARILGAFDRDGLRATVGAYLVGQRVALPA
jgi:mannitol 2-dehydrogenase